jgi:hypothetical protein
LSAKINNKNDNYLILDQYFLPAVYKYNRDIVKPPTMAHSLMSTTKKYFPPRIGHYLSNNGSINNKLYEFLKTCSQLVLLCFKDNFRAEHSTAGFRHHRQAQLLDQIYLNSIIEVISSRFEGVHFLGVNDYEHERILPDRFTSYRELSSDISIARIAVLEIARLNRNSIAIGDCNGSFDITSEMSGHSILCAREGVSPLYVQPFSTERKELDCRHKSRTHVLYSHKNIHGIDNYYQTSASHSKVIERVTEPVDKKVFKINLNNVLDLIQKN